MFAFSQIIAEGANPTAIANQMEKEIKNQKHPDNSLDEDASMAAFAEYMSGEGSDGGDPVKVLAEKKRGEE